MNQTVTIEGETPELELLKRAHAHAVQCWENNWSGGDAKIFIQLMDVLRCGATEGVLINAQTIALCCNPGDILVLWVELFEMACCSTYASVRLNAAALQAGPLHRLIGRMNAEDADKVRNGIALLTKDQDEKVLKNLRVRGLLQQTESGA